MASSKPVARGRLTFALLPLIALTAAACARRPPRLVPPPGELSAVDGYGSASIAGPDASLKGKFGFVFRVPDLGRVEAVDPIGRTIFLVVFRGGRAWFALPGRKVYAEDAAPVMMERFLGVAIRPGEVLRLLSGDWPAGAGPEDTGGWSVERDDSGRVLRGANGDFAFSVKTFFAGGAVPREIGLTGPQTSGKVKVLTLTFNPPPRDGAFDTAFLRAYAPKTWDEILELIER